MNDRALRYFLAVVRTGSIRGAAEAMNLAASAVSRRIAELEQACGTPLLDRRPRGVVPTEAGRIVADHAQRLADEANLVTDRLARLRGVHQGTVRICCGAGFLVDLMENALGGFAAAHPGLSYHLTLGTTEGVLAAVAEGEADLGLAYNPPAHAELRAAIVARQPLFAILPPGHPAATEGRPLPLSAFAGEPVALLPPDHGVRQLLSRVEADGGFRLAPRLESGSFEAQRRFVTAGMGVAFLPLFAVVPERAAGTVIALPLADPLLAEATAHLLVRAGRRLSEGATSLLDCLASHMAAFSSTP